MYANSEGSGETVQMRRLASAFAGRPCDKYMYHNLMSGSFVILALVFKQSDYRKSPKISDTRKNCCNHPKI